jgi:site-specific DNA recombinase
MCREYIMANLPEVREDYIYEYEDEGFSGKNTQRPKFQKMIADLRKYHYDYLICYKLDRLGRNLSDLVNLIDELNKLDTSFISIKERFDTSTPIGRAMMYFTGVLAQMEREQIAERVRDNMLMLARSGRWLGGTTPLGFYSIKEETISWNNKERTSYHLSVNKEEMDTVRFIYHKFLEKHSLTQLESYFLQNNIKTRKGKEYQISTLRDILSNPVYCTADRDSYDYFEKLGCQVCIEEEELDGGHGLISYGKTSSSKYKNKQNSPFEWIVSIGRHRGILSGKDWVAVQQILQNNKRKGDNYKKVRNQSSLLSGILYCKCGAAMRPKNYSSDCLDEKGNRTFAYLCTLKEKSNRKQCDERNIHGNTLDQLVCDRVLAYITPDISVYQGLMQVLAELDNNTEDNKSEAALLHNELKEKKNRMKHLLDSLSKSDGNDTFLKYVEEEINRLDHECAELEKKISDACLADKLCNSTDDLQTIKEQISSYANSFQILTVLEKRDYLKKIIKRIEWDGEVANVFFNDRQD